MDSMRDLSINFAADMTEQNTRTELSSLGEFGLADYLSGFFADRHPETIASWKEGPAAVRHSGDNSDVLVSEIFSEGVHFDLAFTPLRHLGYKMVTATATRALAANARPTHLLVNLALSNRFSLEAVEELFSGMRAACHKMGIDLAQAGVTSSVKGMHAALFLRASAEPGKLVLRKGASSGDLLCVSGDLGGALMGLHLLEREKNVFLNNPGMQPDLEGKDYIIGRQLRPEPRTDILDFFAAQDITPGCMIAVCGGVAAETRLLARQNQLGFNLYEEKIPIDPQTHQTARDFGLDPTIAALNGGEDYELLFTVPQSAYEKVRCNPDITIIGHATDKHRDVVLITRSGNEHILSSPGFENPGQTTE